jgi:hypothetical protein
MFLTQQLAARIVAHEVKNIENATRPTARRTMVADRKTRRIRCLSM